MLPVNINNPTPNAFGVDAAHERFGIAFVVARLINAPDMGEVAKLFGAPRDLLFVESILLKERFYSCEFAIKEVAPGSERGD